MNEREIAEIEARTNAATPGRWYLFAKGTTIEVQIKDAAPIIAWSGFDNCFRELAEHRANAKFIVCAHNDDIPYLLHEVRRLQAVVEKYADRGNWSPLDEHGMNSSEWLLEQEGWKRAESALKDGE